MKAPAGTLALSRPYPCREGGPVLRAVERRIFTLRYFRDCMACQFCRDSCCAHGVDIDLANAGRLRALPPDFHAMVGVPASQWFADEIVADPEFPSGRHVRSRVRDGACVFRNRQGRGCLIHRYCLEKGLDYHAFKPLVSTLFPLTFELGVLVASDELVDGSLVCGGEGESCYRGRAGGAGALFRYRPGGRTRRAGGGPACACGQLE